MNKELLGSVLEERHDITSKYLNSVKSNRLPKFLILNCLLAIVEKKFFPKLGCEIKKGCKELDLFWGGKNLSCNSHPDSENQLNMHVENYVLRQRHIQYYRSRTDSIYFRISLHCSTKQKLCLWGTK